MKSKPTGALFGVLALVAITAIAPSAFAATVEVTTAKGADGGQTADCVAANNCFDPSTVTVAPGDTVHWTFPYAGHTVTSGQATDNQTGTVFDSGLVKKGGDFSFTFADAGTYNYFCMVHPWMTGQVIVSASGGTKGGNESGGMTGGAMTTVEAMSSDASTKVTVDTTPADPTSGKPLTIALTFTDANGNKIHHQNYVLTVTQGGTTVLDNATGHTHTGDDVQTTSALTSSDPVDIQITLNGVGLPTSDPSTWTGPKGDMINFHVVPEFGSIAPIVLAIAVISIVVFTAKTRVIPKL